MRTHVLAAVMTLGMSFDGGVARAAQCFYDSDCPVGTECRSGACVTVGSTSSAPGPAGKPNGTIIILGVAVMVLAVVLYVSVQQQDTGVPNPLIGPMPEPGPQSRTLGLGFTF